MTLNLRRLPDGPLDAVLKEAVSVLDELLVIEDWYCHATRLSTIAVCRLQGVHPLNGHSEIEFHLPAALVESFVHAVHRRLRTSAPQRNRPLCSDCPDGAYPTDITRCESCPRRKNKL